MWLVRAVRIEDLDPLLQLAQSATRGLTSLQLNRNQLHDRIEQSVFAFTRTAESPRAEPYVLVLTNDETGELVGTSTVYAKTGGHQPFYAYRIVASDHSSEQLNVSQHRQRLELERTYDGPSAIGSLFLRGKYRGGGRGRWLSLARFALIAMRPHRFADEVIAEMRGHAEPDGRVPFWESVTGRFIPVEFATADAMSTVSKQFIEEMMPEHPIYLDLLPGKIRHEIGMVHAETAPAIAMLKAEGFKETDLVDIFDAGPVISCKSAEVDAVRRTRSCVVADVRDRSIDPEHDESSQVILACDKNGFTSTLASVILRDNHVVVGRPEADALDLLIGSSCHCLPPRPSLVTPLR